MKCADILIGLYSISNKYTECKILLTEQEYDCLEAIINEIEDVDERR